MKRLFWLYTLLSLVGCTEVTSGVYEPKHLVWSETKRPFAC